MRLYSIWHTELQKFYKGDDWNGRHYWSGTPRYWQTIDGIKKNLLRLGSEYRGETSYSDGPWADDEDVYGFKRYANFDISKLAAIEIIVTDVAVLGETRVSPASLFDEAVPPLETAGH